MRVRLLLLGTVLAMAGLAATAGGDDSVTFQCCQYSKTSVRITPGSTVTWTGTNGADFNQHPLEFLVKKGSNTPAEEHNSNTSTQRTFSAPGVVVYYCLFHGGDGNGPMAGTITISNNTPPTAAFTAPGSSTTGDEVTLDASTSSDPDAGQSLTYQWDYNNDGTVDDTTSAPTIKHTFAAAGTFTVRLTVHDDNATTEPDVGDESSSATHGITVSDPAGSGGNTGGSTGDPNGGTGGSTGGSTPTGGTTTGGTTTDPTGGTTTGGTTSETGGQTAAPKLRLATLAVPRIARLLARGLRLSLTASVAGRVRATLAAGGRTLAGLSRAVQAGSARLTLRLSSAGRRRLRGVHRLGVTLVVRITAADGRTATVRRTLTLRR